MALAERYYAQWKDINNVTHRLEIHEEGYGGSAEEIENYSPTPVTIKRKGEKIANTKVIEGSELVFTFFSTYADNDKYDTIFESDFKDFQIKFYVNSVLKWIGWLLPENFSRDFVEERYFVKLSAIDGLATLKNIEFVDSSGNPYIDRVSILTIAKRCLDNLDFDIDFQIQLNTYETSTASTDCALDTITADSRRFEKNEDGRVFQDNCYKVLEEVLKPFNVTLFQSNGKWHIVNYQEYNSFIYDFDWATLTQNSRTSSNLSVDVTNYNYRGAGSLNKLRPLKTINLVGTDRNLGGNLLNNGSFTANNTDDWTTNGEFYIFATVAAGNDWDLRTLINIPLDGAPSATPNFYTDPFTVQMFEGQNQLEIKFKVRCASLSMDAGFAGADELKKVNIISKLHKGAIGDPVATSLFNPIKLGNSDSTYVEYTQVFTITSEGDYVVEFQVDKLIDNAWADYSIVEIRWDDFFMKVVYEAGEDVTFDKFYGVTNTDDSWVDTLDAELKFGDSIQLNDVGAFKSGVNLTAEWNRYGKTDEESIQVLYARNLLESYGKYKNYIDINLFDPNDNLETYNALLINSRYYRSINFSFIYPSGQRKEIRGRYEEIVNTAKNYQLEYLELNSVDGESTGGGKSAGTGGTSTTIVNNNEIILNVSNLNMSPNATSGDNADTGLTTTGEIQGIFWVNGRQVIYGLTEDIYCSDDGGSTALSQGKGNIPNGTPIYWNGNINAARRYGETFGNLKTEHIIMAI